MKTRTILRAYQKTVGGMCYNDWQDPSKYPHKSFRVLLRQHSKFYLELCKRIDEEQYNEIKELRGQD